MRTLFCAALAVAVFAVSNVDAAAKADKKKGGKAVTGTVKKIDAEKGVITVAVKMKKETVDKEFKLGDDSKVVVVDGDDKKEMTAKDGLKAEQLKEGATVSVVADEDGKVSTLTIGMLKKKKKNE